MNPLRHYLGRQFRLLLRHLRYGRYLHGRRGARARIESLTALFREANRFLQSTGADYWLSYGTLLGYFREGGIIPHDLDLDFGLPERDYERVLGAIDKLSAGCRLYDTSYRHNGPKLYVESGGWDADFYFYRNVGNELQAWEATHEECYTKPVPESFIFPLIETEFLGERTFVPNQTEEFLKHVFNYLGRDGVKDPTTGYWYPPEPEP